MKPAHQLSPLNLRGLLSTLGIVVSDSPQERAHSSTRKRNRNRAIEAWLCPVCLEAHEEETDAELCCDPEEDEEAVPCPVCGTPADSHREAADCCLWKDLDAHTRHHLADQVAAGKSWAEVLGLEPA